MPDAIPPPARGVFARVLTKSMLTARTYALTEGLRLAWSMAQI